MLSNIFLKTLFEKRWTIGLWFAATLVSIFGISMIFPPIRDTMGSMMGSVPESMKNWFGSADTWKTFEGFAGQEIFTQMAVLMVIMAIVFGSAFLAGDEGNRTLFTLLARPVHRWGAYLQKYGALLVMITVVASAYFIGGVLGGWVLGEPVAYGAFLRATLMIWLLGVSLGTLAYGLGAITGRRSLAGLIVGFYAFIAYFISSLSTATDIVDKLSYGSLFRYVAAPQTMASGLDWGNIIVLVSTALIALVLALPIFIRRDLKNN